MQRTQRSCVYAIRCELNGKVYIGCTIDVKARLQQHLCALRHGRKLRNAPHWQTDYDGFGEDAFQAYVLETDIPWTKRSEREAYWIERYHATDPSFGYNKQREDKNARLPIVDGLPPMMKEITYEEEAEQEAAG